MRLGHRYDDDENRPGSVVYVYVCRRNDRYDPRGGDDPYRSNAHDAAAGAWTGKGVGARGNDDNKDEKDKDDEKNKRDDDDDSMTCSGCGTTFLNFRGGEDVKGRGARYWGRRWRGHRIHCRG